MVGRVANFVVDRCDPSPSSSPYWFRFVGSVGCEAPIWLVAEIASFVPVEFVDALFEGWRREVRRSKLRLRQ